MALSDWASPYIADTKTNRKKLNQQMLSSMNEDETLGDFKPVQKTKDFKSEPFEKPFELKNEPFQRHKIEQAFDPKEDPFPTYAPQYDPAMVDKLNYLIRLLEEQRDEKTGYVTEEIILYLFLGIFVIFVLDSFVKTGKYSR